MYLNKVRIILQRVTHLQRNVLVMLVSTLLIAAYAFDSGVSGATTENLILNPVADTYVRADQPTENFGARRTGNADGSPIKIVFLRFDLSSLAGQNIISATLRLKVGPNNSSAIPAIRPVMDTTWDEMALTFEAYPAVEDTIIARVPAGTVETWVETDLAAYLAAQPAGMVSLAITSDESNGVSYYMRDALDKPELVLVVQPMTLPSSTATDVASTATEEVVATATDVASTATEEVVATATDVASTATEEVVATATDVAATATDDGRSTATEEVVATVTQEASPDSASTATDVLPNETATMTATRRPTRTPTVAATMTDTPTVHDTPTATDIPTQTPTDTDHPVSTATMTATRRPTRTPTNTPLPLPSPDAAPVLAAAGDIACDPASTSTSGCKQKETSDLLLSIDPAAVLALGDTQYEKGEYANYLESFDPTWGRLKNRLYPVVGNHEYLTSDATGYYDYFNGTGQTSGPAGDRDKGYYAFDVGTWRIYAINSNCSSVGGCGAGSPQEQWLAADLAANPAQCQLMFMHHPYVSSHTKDSYSSYTQQSVLWQDFYEANGDVVLAGHAHFYERFAEQNPARVADPGRGIRLFVVGTGGKGTYNFGVTRPNSEARIGSTFGVLKLQLHPDSYDWSFIAIDGSVLDAGTTSCH